MRKSKRDNLSVRDLLYAEKHKLYQFSVVSCSRGSEIRDMTKYNFSYQTTNSDHLRHLKSQQSYRSKLDSSTCVSIRRCKLDSSSHVAEVDRDNKSFGSCTTHKLQSL